MGSHILFLIRIYYHGPVPLGHYAHYAALFPAPRTSGARHGVTHGPAPPALRWRNSPDLAVTDFVASDLCASDLAIADLVIADLGASDLVAADFVTCADWGVCAALMECPEGTGLCVTPRRASETRGVVPCLRP